MASPTTTTGTLFSIPLNRTNSATISVSSAEPTMPTIATGVSFVSVRAIGLLTGRPLLSLPPEANCSGTCTLISSGAGASGTVITVLHLGHGPFLPANFSLTVKRALQLGQRTEIGMKGPGPRRDWKTRQV